MTRPKFPPQPNKDGGWTISYKYLEEIQNAIGEDIDAPSLEGIELVLLAIDDVGE